MADRHRPLFNVTISNVPGPPFPLYSIGSRMVANYPVGPLMDGGGLNMTVMSYLDQLDFGLQACPDVLPDLWSLADALPAALDELVKATGVTPAQVKKLSSAQPEPSAARIDGRDLGGVRRRRGTWCAARRTRGGRRPSCAAPRARAGAARSG